ncbi:MAG TPA: lipopolysaccharide heptosyltransferase II [Verrucomicrobiota bacterium]|nr:lipopolysaccharide heptosyltransferase II [Verrucomicrobiota bacterium]
MKILILKPSSLGDVVQALPVARLIKQHQPKAELHWWLNRELVPLLEGDPDLTRVIPFDRKLSGTPRGLSLMWSQIRTLRRERFDWVIDLQGLARSALVGWLSRGGFTIGLRDWREGAPALYDVAVRRATYETHAVDWYLAVLRRLDVPVHQNFTWLPIRTEAAQAVQERCPAPGARWIALQPGARWDNKRWPVGAFAELARKLVQADPGLRIAVLGSAADAPLGREIGAAGGEQVLDLTGRLSLPELVEWLRLCALMVTNDTGPMHIAAALGKPVVAMFGPTDPARTGPYGSGHTVIRMDGLPCIPCLKPRCHWHEPEACLRRVAPERVAQVILERLANVGAMPCPQPASA